MRWPRVGALPLMAVVLIAGCGQPTAPGGRTTVEGATSPQAEWKLRTLTMVVRYEATALTPKAAVGIPSTSTWRAFNAYLFYKDGDGVTRPYLLDAVPQLNTDSWRVQPDGHMEVTYRLRPGLTWHDGAALTAQDFAFAYRAYTMPGLGLFPSHPQVLMEGVDARDARTFVIRWQRPFPEAANFLPGHFDPLPRHLLEDALNTVEQDPVGQQEVFRTHPYWTRDFINAGPFKLERWEQGSQLEGVAFDGHALGRPKIDRVTVRIIGDENTVLSNLLSENVHLATDFTLRHEHAKVLRTDWGANQRGVVIFHTGSMNFTITQFRPEFQKTQALWDLRVRRALAHSIDRQSLNDALFDGEGFMTEQNIPRDARYFPELERAITRYPYDPRRTEQLMNEAGFFKDRDGVFATPGGERFRPDFWVEQGVVFERQLALMTETWARSGIEVQPYVLPAVQVRDNQARASFTGLSTPSTSAGETSLPMFHSAQIGSAANRWAGSNRGGWASAELDRLFDAYNTTLDRSERDRQVIEMMKLTTDQVPAYLLYFNIGVLAHVSALKGPAAGSVDRLHLWNLHEWELTSN